MHIHMACLCRSSEYTSQASLLLIYLKLLDTIIVAICIFFGQVNQCTRILILSFLLQFMEFKNVFKPTQLPRSFSFKFGTRILPPANLEINITPIGNGVQTSLFVDNKTSPMKDIKRAVLSGY